MDALTDRYADLIIQAKAPQIGDAITPDKFARAVWTFARAVTDERARLIAEDLQRISTAAPAANPGERPSPAPGSPQTSGAVVEEVVDEELAPFMEATKELRGRPTRSRRCQVESFPDLSSGALRCPDPAVEKVGVAQLCFAHARIEFALIAQENGIDAARAESSNFSTKEDDHGARGSSAALRVPAPAEQSSAGVAPILRAGEVADGPEATGVRAAEPGADEGAGPAAGGEGRSGASGEAGVPADQQPAAARPGDPSDVAIRGPEAPKEASRGGIAPAAPEVGAQPPAEVAGHAAVEVAQEEAPSVQPKPEVTGHAAADGLDQPRTTSIERKAAVQEDVAKGSDSGEVAGTVAVPAPRSGKRGRKKKGEPVSCRTTEQPEDKQVTLIAWPRWGRRQREPGQGGTYFAWHRWATEHSAEAGCMETTDEPLVWLQPGEDRDPEEICLDCAADKERHVPVIVETGDPGVTAIAHVAPNMDATSKAALEDIAKAAAKMMRESIPRAGKKKASKAKALTCGGTNCSDDGKTIKHHVGDPTCSQYGPREEVTPKVVGKQRASELAAKFEGSAT